MTPPTPSTHILSLLQQRTWTTYFLWLLVQLQWSSCPDDLAEKYSKTYLKWRKTKEARSLWCVHVWQGTTLTATAAACAVNLLHLAAETLIKLCSSARTSGCFGQCQCWENEKFALLSNLPWETSSPIISRAVQKKAQTVGDLYKATWQHKKWPITQSSLPCGLLSLYILFKSTMQSCSVHH